MNLSHAQMMKEMGITPLWKLRRPDVAVALEEGMPKSDLYAPVLAKINEDNSGTVPEEIASLDWESLESRIPACRACALHEHRRQTVFGVGDRQAEWLFIGEGPGAEEDAKGEPFVGQAGKLLDNMLLAIGLRRGERVYIANAVKCRPLGNRTPEAEEIDRCKPFLERQIELIGPRLIVLLGRTAAHSIVPGERGPLSSMRGKRLEYKGIPVVVTYDPVYLLKNLPEKAKVWDDLLFARRLIETAQTPTLF